MKLSYLTVSYRKKQKKRELNIISLQQIVGKHIPIDCKGDIRDKILSVARDNTDKYQVKGEKIFNVLSPNRTNITYSGQGKSPWTLLIGSKGVRRQLHLLLIGNRIWGIELDSGMRMKREANKLGREKLIKFLVKQLDSMIENPEEWENISVYARL